jgi:hypothetical protein
MDQDADDGSEVHVITWMFAAIAFWAVVAILFITFN